MANEMVVWKLADLEKAASIVVRSGLFGLKRPEEVVVLMLVAQSEGLHPVQALTEFYVVNGRPALKAEAMLRRFLAAGGRVEWKRLDDQVAEATFSHPQGGTVTIKWSIEDAQRAGLSSDAWRKYPRAMLRARVLSEGIRTVFPVAIGVYTPEEAMDMEPLQAADAREVPTVHEPVAQPQALEAPMEAEVEPQAEAAPEPQATEAQLRKIWASAKGRLGLDGASKAEAGEIVRAFAEEVVGRPLASVRELTRREASAVIEALEKEVGDEEAGV